MPCAVWFDPVDRRIVLRIRHFLTVRAVASVISSILGTALPGLAMADEVAFHLAVEGGGIVGGAPTLRATEGDSVTIELVSDDDMELHLHGYDIVLPLAPGVPGAFAFDATIAGRFPVEPHHHGGGDHGALFYLEVYPQ